MARREDWPKDFRFSGTITYQVYDHTGLSLGAFCPRGTKFALALMTKRGRGAGHELIICHDWYGRQYGTIARLGVRSVSRGMVKLWGSLALADSADPKPAAPIRCVPNKENS